MINWAERWPDFKIEEILSPMQLKVLEDRKVFCYSFAAIDTLQEFRRFIGKPFLINHGDLLRRGSRSMQEAYDINLSTRGKQNPARAWEYSFHLWCAFDITVEGLTNLELFNKAMEFKKWGGIGLYESFVHCDCRDSLTGEIQTWDARPYKKK